MEAPSQVQYWKLFDISKHNFKETISVKYAEPRHLIRFPINYDEATEEEKKKIQMLRRPKQKLIVQEDKGAKFDPRKYVKF